MAHIYTKEEHLEWLKTLPKTVIGAGILLTNEADKLCVLKTNYKSYFSTPGGVVDEGESPLYGALRETHEEIGLELQASQLKLAQVQSQLKSEKERIRTTYFIFYATHITPKWYLDITLQLDEIESYKFVSRKAVQQDPANYSTAIQLWAQYKSVADIPCYGEIERI